MTFATSSAKHHQDWRFLAEFTDGVSTVRYSNAHIALNAAAQVDMVEGRIASIGALPSRLSYKHDRSGPIIELLDNDGAIEAEGITTGWTVTIKGGFAELTYGSWQTLGTYVVAERPRRSQHKLVLTCISKAIAQLGRLVELPRIEGGDTYIFTTLRTSTDRIGEALPMRFGAFADTGGGADLTYLGYDPVGPDLVFVASAWDKAANTSWTGTPPSGDKTISGVFVDGIEVGDAYWSSSIVTTGNYALLVVKLSLDFCGRYGIIDDKSFSVLAADRLRSAIHQTGAVNQRGRGSELGGRRGGSSGGALYYSGRPVRKVTCNLNGPYTNPVDLFEYLLTYHGPGASAFDSTSYTSVGTSGTSYMDRNVVKVQCEILEERWLGQLIDDIGDEVGIEQYFTAAGKHALAWALDADQTESEAGYANNELISDLSDIYAEPQFTPVEAGDHNPVNLIELASPYAVEAIADTSAISSYGMRFERFKPQYLRCSVLGRAFAWNRIQQNKVPRTVLVGPLSVDGLNRSLGERVICNVRTAPQQGGWSSNVARIRKLDVDVNSGLVQMNALDHSQVESTDSAYMADRSEMLAATLTGVSATSGEDWIETADTDAATLVAGQFIWYSSTTEGDVLCARIVDVVLDSGTYYIFLNRECGFTDTGLTMYAVISTLA